MKRILSIQFALLIFASSVLGMTPVNNASRHPIVYEKPAIDFFEGAVLGNGALGVVVTTRPDAICFHFGHNNVWDIRVAENHKEEIGTFDEIFAKAKAMPNTLGSIYEDPFFNQYLNLTGSNYRKPYPRPFPCGTVVLGIDPRQVEVLGHKIFIDNALCEVYLLNNGQKHMLQIFVSSHTNDLWFRLVDENQQLQPSCFNRLRIMPDSHTPADIPPYTTINRFADGVMGFSQTLPYLEPDQYDMDKGHPKDKMFRLEVKLNAPLTDGVRHSNHGAQYPLRTLERHIRQDQTPFLGTVSLFEGLAESVREEKTRFPETLTPQTYNAAKAVTDKAWKNYWDRSAVDLADHYLEEIWYHNLYFFNASVKEGITCPGIFANWSLGNIGTAWHGDYHLNYNTQQPFWVTFASNHLDKNLPYVDLVEHMLPVSRKWAKEYYNMRGAFFPHSAYPVDMSLHPYPVPDWGWEVFETPWVVQGLWWHYKYSMDKAFLADRAFIPIKDAVLFLVDYMKRLDAHGPQWKDNKYHIFPSVPPELYGLQPGFKYNYDTQIDIALTKFIFKAYLEAVDVLGYKKAEAELTKAVRQILPNLPEYSTAKSEQYGEIYTSVPGEHDKIVYNVPANLTHVFPGEEFGIDAPEEIYHKLVNTYRAHQNEGGNDIVFRHLQAARLGILDLERFKRYVNYATLPNHTVTDMVLQTGGRYDDQTDFAYMAPMGIWFENFALPAVINECLMQSYTGVIHLFPNWDRKNDAAFSTLRAMGAFLISSEMSAGEITYVDILSEKGGECKVKNPWKGGTVSLIRDQEKKETLQGDILCIKTTPNEKIRVQRLNE
ncbi:hypothetical protein [Bacteroides sp. 51]|uniref:glycosyl hydrolase family 95 catalytic domain-containing protein n=1 Tax=Bacteroides sp. 51 TaxID=2302938 RepID=UPI001EF3653C|nr:hypothetical protein [Bacteroides sp. 51]